MAKLIGRRAVGAAVAVLALAGAAAAILALTPWRAGDNADRDGPARLEAYAVGELARLQTPEPDLAPDHPILDPSGRTVTLPDLRGRVVVINTWAMWCAPCRVEMPTLARLAASFPRDQVAVVPVNVDVTPQAVANARAFIAGHSPLAFYSDPQFQLPFLLPGRGAMPQTVILDRRGRVRAALTGEADWAGPEARALIAALAAEDG